VTGGGESNAAAAESYLISVVRAPVAKKCSSRPSLASAAAAEDRSRGSEPPVWNRVSPDIDRFEDDGAADGLIDVNGVARGAAQTLFNGDYTAVDNDYPEAPHPQLSELGSAKAKEDFTVEAEPSLIVQPSFGDGCNACRESLFEPIRSSLQTINATDESSSRYTWDSELRCIRPLDRYESCMTISIASDCASVDGLSERRQAASRRGSLLPGLAYKNRLQAEKSSSSQFHLCAHEAEVLDLQSKIERLVLLYD
jgi:hypothetical protein